MRDVSTEQTEDGPKPSEGALLAGLLVASLIPVIPLGFWLEYLYGSMTAGLVAGFVWLLIAVTLDHWIEPGESRD